MNATNIQAADKTQSRTAIAKVATHIQGLDRILGGGLPQGRTTILNGGRVRARRCWPWSSFIEAPGPGIRADYMIDVGRAQALHDHGKHHGTETSS